MNKLRYAKFVFHCAGLASLTGAVFLAGAVFIGMVYRGYFLGFEPNLSILYTETAIYFFSALYLGFLVQKFMRETIFSSKKETK